MSSNMPSGRRFTMAGQSFSGEIVKKNESLLSNFLGYWFGILYVFWYKICMTAFGEIVIDVLTLNLLWHISLPTKRTKIPNNSATKTQELGQIVDSNEDPETVTWNILHGDMFMLWDFFSLVHSAHLFKQFAQARFLRAATLELGGDIPAATWVMLGLWINIFKLRIMSVFFPAPLWSCWNSNSLQWFVCIFKNSGRWYEGEKPITWCFLAGQKLYDWDFHFV